MVTYRIAYNRIKERLQPMYDEREAAAIANGLLEHILRFDRTERHLMQNNLLTRRQEENYNNGVEELLTGKPLQYVTGIAWFWGMEFQVNEHVLIPRPETEELVKWISEKYYQPLPSIDILDIGTGSGCIPVALYMVTAGSHIISCDISEEALDLAWKNALKNNAHVRFEQLDFLDPEQRATLDMFDVIVSNPPYIPLSEKAKLHINVSRFEPEQALFVPSDDPLVFYKAITDFGKTHLNAGGSIFCELEQSHAEACKILFENAGYRNVEVKKDMHGNLRMLHCVR